MWSKQQLLVFQMVSCPYKYNANTFKHNEETVLSFKFISVLSNMFFFSVHSFILVTTMLGQFSLTAVAANYMRGQT